MAVPPQILQPRDKGRHAGRSSPDRWRRSRLWLRPNTHTVANIAMHRYLAGCILNLSPFNLQLAISADIIRARRPFGAVVSRQLDSAPTHPLAIGGVGADGIRCRLAVDCLLLDRQARSNPGVVAAVDLRDVVAAGAQRVCGDCGAHPRLAVQQYLAVLR